MTSFCNIATFVAVYLCFKIRNCTNGFITADKNLPVESESDLDQIVALRERRETKRSGNDEELEDGCGCGVLDICQTNLHNCHRNATCFSAMGNWQHTCTCNEGFSGDGTVCADIDECSIGTQQCPGENSNCTNTYGSYNCLCKTGYIGDGDNCEDIDECNLSSNPCSSNAKCNNTIGSFECTCSETFYGDGKHCTELRSEHSSRKVYTIPGDPAVLVCSLNETVQWRKEGKLVTNNENITLFRNLLVVTSKDDRDYGEYFCEIRDYPGKGIRMTLFKINEDGNGSDGNDSTNFLIPFIVVVIFLVCSLLAIVYLLLRRRPKLSTTIHRQPAAGDNEYGKSNQISMDVIPSDEAEQDTYDNLSNVREQEPFYQPLVDVKRDIKSNPKSTSDAARSTTGDEGIYDNEIPIEKEDEHVYAEAT